LRELNHAHRERILRGPRDWSSAVVVVVLVILVIPVGGGSDAKPLTDIRFR
jgi:hypothetical protein